jgi:gamma-D-glutamyl-L-lysine dipeptidyl-peptidase
VERRDSWARIRTADDYLGWTPMAGLREGVPYAVTGRVAEVQTLFAHIYREQSVTRHAPLLTLPFESRLQVLDEPKADKQWIEVRLADDRTAWVQAGDVTLQPKTMSISEMLEFSRRFQGLPYTWGGTSSYGYDCSGFSQMLARRRGIVLPRDAQPQSEFSGAAAVDRQHLQPGDLLYFGASEKKITHTGIYLGDGKFINATTHVTPVIRIDDLNEAYWSKLLVAARRLK